MINDNQKILNRLLIVLDALIMVSSMGLGYLIKFYVFEDGPSGGVLLFPEYWPLLAFIVPGYIFLYFRFEVYGSKRIIRRKSELSGIFQANFIGLAALIIVIYVVLREINYSRAVLVWFFFLNVFLTSLSRILVQRLSLKFRKKGYNMKQILLVGYSRAAEEYMDRIRENPQWGYVVRGVLDDHVPAGTTYHGVKVLGTIANLDYILPQNRLDEISVTLPLCDYDRLEDIVAMCEKSGVHTKFIPDYNSLVPSKPYTEDLDGLPVINIRYVPLSNTSNMLIKRAGDIVCALLAIIITSPIMLATAIAIKATSPGPIIFKQERVGMHNKPFNMYKFRSMRIQTKSEERKGWTVKNDPRVTKVGRFIRKTSIDELPQLFNILMGDMSVIGPRPERPQYVEKFRQEIPRYMIKHQVRPGLTGWAQVNGLRGDTSIKKRIEYDIYYIENWTVMFDIKIFLMTFLTGFINRNAY